MREKRDELKRILKEKEQEQRISQFKLNEVKRTIKHNQLKPISKGDDQVDTA